MPGIDVKLGSYDERMAANERFYNSEESLEDNQSTTSSTESRQSDFHKKEHEFIPTRTSGIMASKPAANPNQFTRINSNPLLISAQKQMLLVEEVKKKKEEVKVGEDIPDWQSNLDGWKLRRRKQSEDAISRVQEIKRIEDQEFIENVDRRKLSIGKKLSIKVDNDDKIDWDDFGLGDEPSSSSSSILPISSSSSLATSLPKSSSVVLAPVSKSSVNGGRRDSRGFSQEKDIPEEKESDVESGNGSADENIYNDSPEEDESSNSTNTNAYENSNPYENAIEGYKMFAKSQLPCEDIPVENTKFPVKLPTFNHGVKDKTDTQIPPVIMSSLPSSVPIVNNGKLDKLDISPSLSPSKSPLSTSPSKSSSSSSIPSKSSPLSSLSAPSPSPESITSIEGRRDSLENNDVWKEKIESFVQPTRRLSSELSSNMKLKVASFEENRKKEMDDIKQKDTPVTLQKDTGFTDKLKAFKSIETVKKSESPMGPPKRRESEPPVSKFKGFPAIKSSSSSSFMNTHQNNKFFQQNSLGSEDEQEGYQLVDDALEESFSVLEDSSPSEPIVFKDDDFLPDISKLPPPDEKPPPLPSVPPPELDAHLEDDIDKQEREIIESLEREEQEHNKYLESLSSPRGKAPSSQPPSVPKEILLNGGGLNVEPKNIGNVDTEKNAPQQMSPSRVIDPVVKKREKNESAPKDYNKHWLIQEAEQRRIQEAEQRKNQEQEARKIQEAEQRRNQESEHRRGTDVTWSNQYQGKNNHTNYEKFENVNNNNGLAVDNELMEKLNGGITNGGGFNVEKKTVPVISDNIYANVDPNSINMSKKQGTKSTWSNTGSQATPVLDPSGLSGQIPGPQVPPRQGEGQDRVLSVSGKKKCSHCKDELGRGAAMIIESLRLFYHIRCFQCCVCSVQLGNGSAGTDVRVRNNKLHCQNCYSNDEGLKFSKV